MSAGEDLKLKDIKFPKELLKAQQDGTLVIFCGAGISMGEPSNLPSFRGLVEKIAQGTKFAKSSDDPPDQLLGNMVRDKVEVKRRAKQILGDPTSEPTETHQLVLKVSRNAKNNIRIVTTNLDSHLTVSAKNLSFDVEEYFAPALPLGNDFSGIVYLHGSITKSEDRFILTDSDFGRAYLIEGWATRFVKEMFLQYTVLFIGYSHNDAVMNYISRGMPTTMPGRRFAIIPEGNVDHWKGLGITPVEYPKGSGSETHIALLEGLREWGRYISMGLLDHERRIQELVSGKPPPINQDDAEYILDRIFEKNSIQFFIKYAITPDWIFWADNQGLLKSLFDVSGHLDDLSRQLGYWLAGNFLKKYPYHLLSLIEKKKSQLHPEFWTALASSLNNKAVPLVDRKAFAIWVSLLLRKTYEREEFDMLEFLLDDCTFPEDQEAAIALFSHLTKPVLELEKKIYAQEGDEENHEKMLDADIGIRCHSHWLTKSWNDLFRTNFSSLGDRLFFILKEHVETAYDLIGSFEGKSGKYDSISYQRSAIERHEQNHRLASDFPNLLDCFADILEWISYEREDLAKISLSWHQSKRNLFKRFSIFVAEKNTFQTPEEKCDWLIPQEIIFNYHTHHEVFGLLREIFPKLSEKKKRELIVQIMRGPQDEKDLDEQEDLKVYPAFRVLAWLQNSDPGCTIVNEKLEEIKNAHPEYRQMEHPDLHGFTTGAVWVNKSESPYASEDLISMDLEGSLETLLNWVSTDRFSPNRSGLIATVESATQQDLAFSFRLGQILREKNLWETDLWDGIIRGWIKANLSEDDWKMALSIPLENRKLLARTQELSDLLADGILKKDFQIPENCFDSAMTLAELLWKACIELTQESSETSDWVTAAINHPAGKLTEFWLRLLSRYKDESDRLPDRVEKNLDIFLSHQSRQGKLSRAIIASQAFFLFTRAKAWTVQKVIPLFDIERDERAADVAWDGYLTWGRWSDEFLEFIRPLFQKIFKKMEVLGDSQNRFLEYVAGICLYATTLPHENAWITDFLINSTAESRESFSRNLQRIFRLMTPEGRSIAWRSWIREYWVNRDNGVPLKFDNSEKVDLIEVGIHLDEQFSEAVDLFTSSESPVLERSLIFHDLHEDKIAEKHPEKVLQLLLHLLPAQQATIGSCYYLEPVTRTLIEKLGKSEAYRTKLVQLCGLLAELQCTQAIELRALIS